MDPILLAVTKNILAQLACQTKNCEFWFGEWKKWKDMGAFRNAVFAVGKVNGVYLALDSLYKNNENVPGWSEELQQSKDNMIRIFDELQAESGDYLLVKRDK